MNKLDRFRYGNVHKRRIVRSLVVVTGIFAASLLILAGLGIFGSRSELVRIRLSSSYNGRNLEGVGINLTDVPTVNRVRDFSFAQGEDYTPLTIVDAAGDYIYFDPEEGSAVSEIPTGSELKVLSLDNDGVMSMRFSGTVDGVDEACFGLLNEVEDTEGYWLNDRIVKTVALDSTIVALTADGRLILDITSVQLVKTFEDDTVTFVDICASDACVYALSSTGDVYVSNDGRNFDLYSQPESYSAAEGVQPLNIVCVNGNAVVIDSAGDLIVYSQGVGRKLTVAFDTANLLIDSNGTYLIAVTTEGEVYVTANGFIFSQLDVGSCLSGQEIIDHDHCDDSFSLLTTSGKLISIIPDADQPDGIASQLDISSVEPEKLAVSDDGNVIVVTSDKKACLISSEDGRVSDLTSNAGTVDDVLKGVGDRVITVSGNNLYLVTVLSGVRINASVPEESVFAGDLCIISNTSQQCSNWETIGDGTTLSCSNTGSDPSSFGRIVGSGDGVHAISQQLYGNSMDNFSENTFYRLSFRVRSESSVNDVKIWVSGDTFGDVGIDASDVDDKMKEYTLVFAVTGNMLADETVRLNISFEGDGVICVDDIYLGEDRYEIDSVPSEFSEPIIEGKPSAIRLGNIVMGSDDLSDETFYGTGPDSLETSMQLVKDGESVPWFVIGSYADLDSIDSWLDYMCGSVKSNYGRMRIDNGTALPWSRQFDTIYIEITDDDGAYQSDMQRGAYVSYVMGLITQSRYYSEVKDKLVFLDGMTYDGGTVLSAADYHTMDMTINLMGSVSHKNRMIDQAFEDLNYDAPRFPSRSADSGEFVRSLNINDISGNLSAGEIISSLATDSVRMIMIDITPSVRPVDTESDAVLSNSSQRVVLNSISQIRFMRHADSLYYELADPMDAASGLTADQFSSEVSVMLMSQDGKTYLVVANTSQTQQQYIIEGVDVTLDDAVVRRYSAEGNLLTSRRLSRSDVRHTLQAGEFSVIEIG